MKIIYDSDITSLTKKASSSLAELSHQYSKSPILLLLSGGSAFNILKGMDISLGSHITIGVLDERYSTDPGINNFAQLMVTDFYKQAKESGVHFIDTQLQNEETQEQLAQRYDEALKKWKQNNPEGVIIATQGIGPDGHTSGIMPFPEDPKLFQELFENDKWLVGYDATGKNPYTLRVTTTNIFLREIDHSILYVTGENKKEVLQKALQGAEKSDIPSAIIKEMKDVQLFTDIELN